jgi:hypothetical protein
MTNSYINAILNPEPATHWYHEDACGEYVGEKEALYAKPSIDALVAEVERLSALADKWNLECDEFREDNKRLAHNLEVVLVAANHLNNALEDLIDKDTTPEPNCSCCISPPCNDCVDFAGIRETIENGKDALKEFGDIVSQCND